MDTTEQRAPFCQSTKLSDQPDSNGVGQDLPAPREFTWLSLTSPRRVAAAAGKPHRWPTHHGHSTASDPSTR